MPKSFKCPSCAGPLDFDGGNLNIRCKYCGNHVMLPEELRGAPDWSGAEGFVPLLGQAVKLAEVARLVRAGNKIEAIKVYRETFGCGLREAKDAVEQIEQGRPLVMHEVSYPGFAASPARMTMQQETFKFNQPLQATPRASSGCITPVLIAVFSLTALIVVAAIAIVYFAARRTSPDTVTNPTSTTPTERETGKTEPEVKPGFARELLAFGSEGIGAGQFKDARTIAVDGEGRIYTGEYTGGRVQVFDAQGKFITQWMVDAKMPLLKIAADRKGVVYVVQRGEINRYEGATGTPLGSLPKTARARYEDVTIALDGSLFAVEDNENIVRLSADGQSTLIVERAVSSQTDRSELDASVAVDGLGNLYVLGRFNDAVFKFNASGKFLNKFGGGGNQPGQFRATNAVAVDNQGRVYVSDIKGIQVFDTDGRYLDTIKLKAGVPFDLVFNDKNELFVAVRTKMLKLEPKPQP